MPKLNFVKIGAAAGEDPKEILEDAANPLVPAFEVLARARMRSRNGKLVQAVAEKIAQLDW